MMISSPKGPALRRFVHVVALVLGPCLVTDQLAEPAFSNVFFPVRPSLNAWVANFHPGEASRAVKDYSRHLKEVSLFGVGADRQGRLASESDFIDASLSAMRK